MIHLVPRSEIVQTHSSWSNMRKLGRFDSGWRWMDGNAHRWGVGGGCSEYEYNFSILLYILIFYPSSLLLSSLPSVQVSAPYNTTGHTNVFTILFFNVMFKLFVMSSCILLSASFAMLYLLSACYSSILSENGQRRQTSYVRTQLIVCFQCFSSSP